jgi:hypothetical protein
MSTPVTLVAIFFLGHLLKGSCVELSYSLRFKIYHVLVFFNSVYLDIF